MNKSKPIKLIFSAGGTGGHIIPALTVADEIKNIKPNTEILFIGAEGRMEMEKVPGAGYKIVGLPIAGWQRRLTYKNLKFPFLLMKSLFKAFTILNAIRPDGVVGFGGYASGPVLKIAQLKKIPTFIQEQNSYPGITNKWLAKKAKRIYTAYEDMDQFFPASRIQLTGNPIRSELLDSAINKAQAFQAFDLDPAKPVIFCMGGSQGARSLNRGLKNNFNYLINNGYQVIWQTGRYFYEEAVSLIESKDSNHLIKPFIFINDIEKAYKIATVVVARAGAISIAELSAAGKACIFVPLPMAAEDHQRKNALKLVEKNAADMILDNRFPIEFPQKLDSLINNPEKREQLEKNIRTFARNNATEDIAGDILNLLEEK
ncbi:MAG: undecaprenyldiphospho-muramoylpentapeptide beta-N-acetylglucosaminyltransferase [Bacteroidales bacterium]|nr:undecaprenyldiphospho-muramoylpentapeptide beta-N-acetylglucosaminyltransferase [Bacteroidales bacterium]MCF8333293.1 undecaprenyldiphospho-muramoylpentapeptide beta-N-acetylglucosaminyltransferase [Bacteroidales bacterium]